MDSYPKQPTLGELLESIRSSLLTVSNFDPDIPISGPVSLLPGASGGVSFWTGQPLAQMEGDFIPTKSTLVIGPRLSMRFFPRACAVGEVDNPKLIFARLIREAFSPKTRHGVSPRATVNSGSSLGEEVSVGPGTVIECASLGPRTVVGANCMIGDGVIIGADCRIGPNTSIGVEGFGYVRDESGRAVRLEHFGGVRIGNSVEIGANVSIARGFLEDTVIEDGVKIDNLVHIAHNVHIGRDALVIASSSISGSVTIGPRAWIAPNSTILQHLTIGADAVVGLGAVVVRDIPERAQVMGLPAREMPK